MWRCCAPDQPEKGAYKIVEINDDTLQAKDSHPRFCCMEEEEDIEKVVAFDPEDESEEGGNQADEEEGHPDAMFAPYDCFGYKAQPAVTSRALEATLDLEKMDNPNEPDLKYLANGFETRTRWQVPPPQARREVKQVGQRSLSLESSTTYTSQATVSSCAHPLIMPTLHIQEAPIKQPVDAHHAALPGATSWAGSGYGSYKVASPYRKSSKELRTDYQPMRYTTGESDAVTELVEILPFDDVKFVDGDNFDFSDVASEKSNVTVDKEAVAAASKLLDEPIMQPPAVDKYREYLGACDQGNLSSSEPFSPFSEEGDFVFGPNVSMKITEEPDVEPDTNANEPQKVGELPQVIRPEARNTAADKLKLARANGKAGFLTCFGYK